MNKCPVCKTGALLPSGSHVFCDKCNFSSFIMTQGYIDSCIVVLAELTSNTKFTDKRAFATTVLGHIAQHLPMLDTYLNTIVDGRQELGTSIFKAVEDQAINLQLGEEVLNATAAAYNLRCQCGNEDFYMVSPGKLVCTNEDCEAVYLYDEAQGNYQPEFLCKCGSASYIEDEGEPIVQCNGCAAAYLKTVNGFQPLAQ